MLKERDIQVYSQYDKFEPPYWNRHQSLQLIKEFYQQQKCKMKLEIWVLGWIRKHENQCRIHIPLTIKDEVLQYAQINF